MISDSSPALHTGVPMLKPIEVATVVYMHHIFNVVPELTRIREERGRR